MNLLPKQGEPKLKPLFNLFIVFDSVMVLNGKYGISLNLWFNNSNAAAVIKLHLQARPALVNFYRVVFTKIRYNIDLVDWRYKYATLV